MLRSTDFVVKLSRRGGRIDRVTIEGRGYGHAVGMCQYGAIGRARAGQDYATILTSYFPGTTLSRIY
jgi:stage II sporulation protein D